MCWLCKFPSTKDIYISIDTWYPLFEDTGYHRPKSNDIFYRKHLNKKGRR